MVEPGLLRFLVGRIVRAILLVIVVASGALVLVHLAPGDAFTRFDLDPAVAAVERQRLGFDRPFLTQYIDWLSRSLALDLGESVRFRRPVASLLGERAWNTVLLGVTAIVCAIAVGLPAGVVRGSAPGRWSSRAIGAASLLLVSVPPLIMSLVLLLVAARQGWLPMAGAAVADAAAPPLGATASLWLLPLPALALALPIAASLERLQARAMAEALAEPSILAARARGLSSARAVWVHAWRLALRPVLGVLGVVFGTVLSGSFVVEIVMSWRGLGDLMYQALLARDIYLAAGCAAAGAAFLSAGLLLGDLALLASDPRARDVT